MKLLLYITKCFQLISYLQASTLAVSTLGSTKDRHYGQTLPSLIQRDWHPNAFTIHNAYEHWSVHFNAFHNPANPLQTMIAANDLSLFYSATLAVARVVWAQGTPQRWRRASMGGLVLIFWSESPIPWEWLNAFLMNIVSDFHGP